MQLSFEQILSQTEKSLGTSKGKAAQIIASLLVYSLELEEKAMAFKGPDSAQKRLTQFQIAKGIRARISAI